MYKCRYGGMCDYKERGSMCSFDGICGAKQKIPEPKDLVEVVRCKDCRKNNNNYCKENVVKVSDVDYCSWGERRVRNDKD